MSALMHAARNGHEDCVKLLLPRSDPLARDSDGCSALMWAARLGHRNCVSLLLPLSDPWAQTPQGNARHLAAMGGYVVVTEMIDAHIAQREAGIIYDHISPRPPTRIITQHIHIATVTSSF